MDFRSSSSLPASRAASAEASAFSRAFSEVNQYIPLIGNVDHRPRRPGRGACCLLKAPMAADPAHGTAGQDESKLVLDGFAPGADLLHPGTQSSYVVRMNQRIELLNTHSQRSAGPLHHGGHSLRNVYDSVRYVRFPDSELCHPLGHIKTLGRLAQSLFGTYSLYGVPRKLSRRLRHP